MVEPRAFYAETPQHEALYLAVWDKLGDWRRFIVAVDGRDGVGKTTTARYLAWQLGATLIELDSYVHPDCVRDDAKVAELGRVIGLRLDANRPVIVEGIFVLEVIRALGLGADFVVHVEQRGASGSTNWRSKFEEYERQYRLPESSDFRVHWDDETGFR